MTIQGPTLVYKPYFLSNMERFTKKPVWVHMGFILGFLCIGLQFLLFMRELLQRGIFAQSSIVFFIIRIVMLGITAMFLSRFWYMQKWGFIGTMIGLILSIIFFL